MEITRREFLEGLPKTALNLAIASQALSGLDSLVFGEEDYLSKLPPLNGRKVTEELIQEMLNVGSVRGILEKYGNKDNIFYVQFEPDGKNNLDELVRRDPEKWDGSYVLVSGNKIGVHKHDFMESIVFLLVSQVKKDVKFIYYGLENDFTVRFNNRISFFGFPEHHFLKKLFKFNKVELFLPVKLLYSKKGNYLDGGVGGAVTNRDAVIKFSNDCFWIEHWLYEKYQRNENREEIIIRYNLTDEMKVEKRR